MRNATRIAWQSASLGKGEPVARPMYDHGARPMYVPRWLGGCMRTGLVYPHVRASHRLAPTARYIHHPCGRATGSPLPPDIYHPCGRATGSPLPPDIYHPCGRATGSPLPPDIYITLAGEPPARPYRLIYITLAGEPPARPYRRITPPDTPRSIHCQPCGGRVRTGRMMVGQADTWCGSRNRRVC
jgi:hypothetical protein